MPPKSKRQRASFNPTTHVDLTPADESTVPLPRNFSDASRQVVEVVEEGAIDEVIETIKKDAQEIEDAVENLEEAIEQALPEKESIPTTHHEEVVESLFSSRAPDVRPEITVVGKKDKSLAVWVGAMLGIAVAVGVGLVFLVKGSSGMPSIGAKPTPTNAPTTAPTPTTTTVVERKDISVRVLNGGGVVGAASKMKTFLEDKGYTVISMGNTPEYTYDSTVIQVKEGKESFKTMLTDDLKVDFTLESSAELVAPDAAYDAVVIVGKE